MIAVPIGPRVQRFGGGAAPAYLAAHGTPGHPRQLLDHDCIRQRFASGAMTGWEFERDGEVVKLDPAARLVISTGATDMAIATAEAGLGIVFMFEDWLLPSFASGRLVPVLESWWPSFSGPFLYYPSRRFMPAPLRAFVDFIKR